MGKGGKAAAAALTPKSDFVHSDPRFRPFLEDSFDAASFASRALAETHTSPQVQTEQLQQGIQLLDSQLRQEVSSRQQDLISQASRLHESEAALQRITLSVRSLQSVAARVRAEVADPYRQILGKSVQLRNLQRTVDLLRHAIHRLKLVQKLRAQMAMENAGILEVAKAARLLSDIVAVDAEVDLVGLDVVDADTQFVVHAAAQVRSQAEAALQAGLASLSQADVGSALQVLFNLGQLKQAIASRVDSAVASLERSLAAALDARKLTAAGSGKAGPGAAAPGSAAKDVLWDRLGGVCDALHRAALEVWHLQRVLAKKRDPLSHVLLLDVVAPPPGAGAGENEGGELPLEVFWSHVCASMGECFASAFNTARGGLVREALAQGYPRLAALLEDTAGRLVRDSAVKDADPAITEEQALALLDVASDFQNAYLAASLARMSDAVSSAFPGGTRSLPTAADLQKSIARIHEELKGAGAGGARMSALAARGVASALHLLAEKAEQMAATGPDLRSVSGACTPAQLRNLGLCNSLQEVYRSLAALLPRMHPAAAEELREPLEAVQAVAVECVTPTFRAMVEAAQDALLAMHKQASGWGGEGLGAEVAETSPYMQLLGRHITHCRVEYLSKLQPSPSAPVPSMGRVLVERMAARLLVFFVRHAALLRPLGQAGKIQLAKDMGELEAAITQHLLPMDQLGSPARILRAFRRLLFMPREGSDVAAEPAAAAGEADVAALEGAVEGEEGTVGEPRAGPAAAPEAAAAAGAAVSPGAVPALLRDLPRTALLHYLFSQGPVGLASPHARVGLTPMQYSLWLDEHSQDEAVKFIRAALEAGESHAGSDPTYKLMRRIVAGEF